MPPEALSDEMTETLTPSAAARVLTDAAGFERALERRTEGLTLMVWGLVNSALFVTYGFADVLGATGLAFSILWIPWVTAGVLMTFALWRSAALSRSRPAIDDIRTYWIRTLGLVLGIGLVFALVRPNGPTLPLAILGAAYALIAAINLFGSHAEDRKIAFTGGAVLVVVAVTMHLLAQPIEVTGTVSIAAPLVVLGGLGLWQTMRG